MTPTPADDVVAALAEARAEIARLKTLLARSLVFDTGSAEEGADACGGFPAVLDLVNEHHVARVALRDAREGR